MHRSPAVFFGTLAFSFALAVSAIAAGPKLEEWTDTQGNKFKGEASEALGPLAVFRTGQLTGRKLAFRFLTPPDCVRFYQATQNKPARAADWADAKSEVSADLRGHVTQMQGDKLVEFDVKGRPEPLIYVVFYASTGEGGSWEMMGQSSGAFQELARAFPGEVEAVYFGLRHKLSEHRNMITSMHVPYLVCDYYEQSHMSSLARFAPNAGYLMIVLTRHGVPLFAAENPNKDAAAAILSDVAGVLHLLDPAFPKGWQDRAYYLRSVQPAIHASDRADPILVGNPLRTDGLKQRKIFRVAADLKVAASGDVTDVNLKPDPSISEKMAGPLADALKKALFVPAVDHGNFVDATYSYLLEIPQ